MSTKEPTHHRPLNLAFRLAVVSMAAWSPSAWAQMGAVGFYEVASENVGNAAAGAGADPTTAAIAHFNPAGMANLPDGHHFSFGGQFLYSNFRWTADGDNEVEGSDHKGPIAVPNGGVYGAFDVHEQVRVGFAVTVPYGSRIHYDEGWAGRYHNQRSDLIGLQIMPTVSWKPLDWFSIGAGISGWVGILNQEYAVNNNVLPLGEPEDDGLITVDGTAGTVSGTVGVTFTPGESTIIGAVYRAPVRMNFKGTAVASGLGELTQLLVPEGEWDAEVGFTLPQSFNVSVYQGFFDKFAVLADVGWTDWSAFSENELDLGEIPLEDIDRQFDDTWRFGFGLHVLPIERLRIRTGFSFDSAPVSDKHRTADLPVGPAWRVAGGIEGQITDLFKIGAHYTAILPQGGEYDISQPAILEIEDFNVDYTGVLSGQYKAVLHVMTVTFGFTFD